MDLYVYNIYLYAPDTAYDSIQLLNQDIRLQSCVFVCFSFYSFEQGNNIQR